MRVIRPAVVLIAGVMLLTFVAGAACGGGDSKTSDRSNTPAATTTTGTSTSASAGGSPSAGKTPGAQTPGTAATPAPSTAAGGPTPGAAASTPSSFEATLAAEVGSDVSGGDPSDPRETVGEVPTPPTGATIDPTNVAEPDSGASGVQIIVDMDAAQPGLQDSRSVRVGDVFRVAIIVANVPSDGLNAFNFFLSYDKAKVVAPSYSGGSSSDRNPDLYEAALGDGWTCLPAPEGDLDDPGGINGDGLSSTGRALLSCFNPSSAPTGTIVVATVEFRAIAAGGSDLALSGVSVAGGASIIEFGHCEGDVVEGTVIPCRGGSVSVQ